MLQKCLVSVAIRNPGAVASSREIELGEFQAVWSGGISIGSDQGCTVVLPDLAPVAARVIGASNHKLLYRCPEGASLPLPKVSDLTGPYERVDYQEFRVGPYLIRFGEVYRKE